MGSRPSGSPFFLSPFLLIGLFGGLLWVFPLSGQEPGTGDPEAWNSPRTLELLEKARARRQEVAADSGLQSYAADARGYVYFYLDRAGSEERELVKVDQIALEIYWMAPNRTRQRIVGLRDEKRLPTDIHYHLDHLTVVQDDFADRIRIGDGDEVRDVLHPVAPRSEDHYDFRLADSVTVTLAAPGDEVRVYEIQVRPTNPRSPGYVGSLFLDRATAAIVRMDFTFTPVSYVDGYLDFIHISIENGLWEGRWWLPYRQRLEIRRQLPFLDFPIGGVIRGSMRIGNYRFNQVPPYLFDSRPVTAMPRSVREAFPFEQGLHAELAEEGLTPTRSVEAVRQKARELMEDRYLSGLPPLRMHVPAASSAFRFNRAEGPYLGWGLSWVFPGGVRAKLEGGYAFGPSHPEFRTTLERDGPGSTTTLSAGYRELRDMGPLPGSSGAMNTLAAAFLGSDYLDPYFSSGVVLRHERGITGSFSVDGTVRLEEHRSGGRAWEGALFDPHDRFRPVRSVAEGRLSSVALGAAYGDGFADWEGRLSFGRMDDETFVRLGSSLELRYAPPAPGLELEGRLHGGLVSAFTPPQHLFLLGGRETLPGYGFRSFTGDRFLLGRLHASHPLVFPWVRLRAFLASGYTALRTTRPPTEWNAGPTDGIRGSAGVGLGLGFDILRVDLARGLDGGSWEVLLSADHRFWDWL